MKYGRKRRVREVDALLSVFTPENMARMPRSPLLSQRPVFIVGMPRSGTSLVEQILASHPEVYGAGEMRDVDAEHPILTAYLRETLLQWVSSVFRPGADATAGPESMSRDECEALKALGYLSADQACPES